MENPRRPGHPPGSMDKKPRAKPFCPPKPPKPPAQLIIRPPRPDKLPIEGRERPEGVAFTQFWLATRSHIPMFAYRHRANEHELRKLFCRGLLIFRKPPRLLN